MKSLVTRFIKDESGATAIEYGLIAGLMAVVVIGAWATFGDGLTNTLTEIGNKLDTTGDNVASAGTTSTETTP